MSSPQFSMNFSRKLIFDCFYHFYFKIGVCWIFLIEIGTWTKILAIFKGDSLTNIWGISYIFIFKFPFIATTEFLSIICLRDLFSLLIVLNHSEVRICYSFLAIDFLVVTPRSIFCIKRELDVRYILIVLDKTKPENSGIFQNIPKNILYQNWAGIPTVKPYFGSNNSQPNHISYPHHIICANPHHVWAYVPSSKPYVFGTVDFIFFRYPNKT